jgi:hypothetical protein
MTSSIILKKSSVAGRIPATGDLAYGELGLNYADGALYFKRSDNTIQNLIVASSTPFLEYSQVISTDYTVTAGKKALAIGPVTINAGISVTVGTGQNWLVLNEEQL